MADGPIPVEGDRVDRAEDRGVRRKLVQVPDHGLFARVGDVQAVEAEPSRRTEEVADGVRGEPEPVDVDEPVKAAKPMLVRLSLIERGTQGGADS
jgi:hypothetical protein